MNFPHQPSDIKHLLFLISLWFTFGFYYLIIVLGFAIVIYSPVRVISFLSSFLIELYQECIYTYNQILVHLHPKDSLKINTETNEKINKETNKETNKTTDPSPINLISTGASELLYLFDKLKNYHS